MIDLETILPKLISPNKLGFVKGRTIVENMLLAQGLVTDMEKRERPSNVVLKLYMAKDYDRVFWYFNKSPRKYGFSSRVVNAI